MLNKILIVLILLFLSSTSVVVLINRTKTAENALLVQKAQEQEKEIEGLKIAIERQGNACEIADSLASEFQQERRRLSAHANNVISKIGEVKNEQDEASVDSKLPAGLVSLLKQASNE